MLGKHGDTLICMIIMGIIDIYYEKFDKGFNIKIDDKPAHDSSYYISEIENCIESYVEFIKDHNENITQ